MVRATHPVPFVVIAHQSAIPHYRVEFYNQLSEACNGQWDFGVIFDPDQQRISRDFEEQLPPDFMFKTLPVQTRQLRVLGKNIVWQGVGGYTHTADMLITDTHLSNLGYWTAALTRPSKCKWVLWGHSENRNTNRILTSGATALIKRWYVKKSDAVFAYTADERDRFIKAGVRPDCIHVLNNTINLRAQRAIALEQKPRRPHLREKLQFSKEEFVFLMVGRLLPGRRVDFLVEAFKLLCRRYSDVRARLVIVGAGSEAGKWAVGEYPITMTGPIVDAEKLGEYLTAADSYLIPGMIGLAPLQALAHELPVTGFDLTTHGPEVEYLNTKNSALLAADTTIEDFADYLYAQLKGASSRWNDDRYNSVSHLTIEAMVQKFHNGVKSVLSLK